MVRKPNYYLTDLKIHVSRLSFRGARFAVLAALGVVAVAVAVAAGILEGELRDLAFAALVALARNLLEYGRAESFKKEFYSF